MSIEIKLHIIRGHPTTLQEAVAYEMEADVILEFHNLTTKRSNVCSVEDSEPESERRELALFAKILQKLEKRLNRMDEAEGTKSKIKDKVH